MIYDFAVVGGGASGIFSTIFASKTAKKIILEKNKNLGVKVLLSGGERANLTNIDIEATRDYFGQNKKAMISLLKNFSQYDTMSYFEDAGVSLIEEDRGRIILTSGNSRELLNVLEKKSKENNTEFKTNFSVVDIEKKNDIFYIKSENNDTISAKNVLISSGGRSFYQVGTTGDTYKFADKFGIKLAAPNRGLSGIVTKKDLSDLSGVSLDVMSELIDKRTGKMIYSEYGPLLFTHFGFTGPIIFNISNAIGEFFNKLESENTFNNFSNTNNLIENDINYENESNLELQHFDKLLIKLTFDLTKTPKRIVKFFDLSDENLEKSFEIQNFRSWKESKVSTGGILLNELTKNLESKAIKGLFFAGEALDLTGKTGGFNLQLAWSSGYIVGKSIY